MVSLLKKIKGISCEESRDDFPEAWDTQKHFNQFVSYHNVITGVLLPLSETPVAVSLEIEIWDNCWGCDHFPANPIYTIPCLKFSRERNTELQTSFHAVRAIPTFPSARGWGWIVLSSKGTPIADAVCSRVRALGCLSSPPKSSWKLWQQLMGLPDTDSWKYHQAGWWRLQLSSPSCFIHIF